MTSEDNDRRQPMLTLNNVSLDYRSSKGSFDNGIHHVLDQVSFRLYESETLGIIGRNGVGKTTILRLMAGIFAPTRGKVTLQKGKTAALLSLGLGFNNELSGRDNALLSTMLQGSTLQQARDYLEQIKEFSELGESFDEPVSTYSAGMRSRLGFTTALLTHVDILLIDEVLSVGDAHFKQKAQTAMKARISSEQTVVFVSHSEPQVKELCDRVIWLDKGRLKADGEPEVVLKAYREALNPPKPAPAAN
ncbi:MAG: ABC transporter ATP-binding protein [Parahaliea sp.]